MQLRSRTAAFLGGLALAACVSQTASAAPLLGGQLSYAGGLVTVTTLPVTSGYQSELGLYDSTFTLLQALTMDEPAGVSVTFDPGSLGVAVGAELVFGIRVISDGSRKYFMGPGTRNPDGLIHASLDGPYTHPTYGLGYEVGFEDLFGGGDRDYDDNRFFFRGGLKPVPEPGTIALLGLALGGLGLARRRRN